MTGTILLVFEPSDPIITELSRIAAGILSTN